MYNEIYTTTITIHPRVVQLQRILTLDDYLQIQALLEYFQKRQSLINENQHAQLRLERALNNIRLLKLEYRRQRAAQIQRLLQQYHEQCYQYDRTKLICALEQRRAQLAFRQFLEQQQQQDGEEEVEEKKENIESTTLLPEVKQLNNRLVPSETCIQTDDNKIGQEPLAIQPEIVTQDNEKDDDDDDEEEYDDEYEKYQSQQLEDLLKLLFEKHQHKEELNHQQEQQQSFLPQFEKKKDEVYEPLYRQTGPVSTYDPPFIQRQTGPVSTFDDQPIFQRQTAPVSTFDDDPSFLQHQTGSVDEYDQQTLSDILPLLQQQEIEENKEQEQNKGIETSSISKDNSDINQPQPTLPKEIKEEKKVDNDNKPLLPDHVTSLEDVLNQLVHSSTPTPLEKEEQKEMKIDNEINHPPPPQQENPEVLEKLNKLNEIEQRIERLYDEHHEKAIKVPLQYQVNGQGKLFLDGNTPDNRLFLGYEDDVVRCMLQLDNILSDGNINIRNQRRKIIQRAESILEQLDRHKQQEWEKETRKQNDIQESVNVVTSHGSGSGKKHRHRKRKHHVPVTA